MITYRKKGLCFVECWNGEISEKQNVDIVRLFQQAQPRDGMLCREFHTVLIDLTKSSNDLFAAMKRGTRYEIRRAETTDGLRYHRWNQNDRADLDRFCECAQQFLKEKQQPPIDRNWIELLSRNRSLELTRIDDLNEQPLVWHAYHCNSARATLLYSVSSTRNGGDALAAALLGRANRLLHWKDILHFKTDGRQTYDFGGWYSGKTNDDRLRINRFKEQFGGEVVKNYICEKPLTWKGSLFLKVRGILLGDAI